MKKKKKKSNNALRISLSAGIVWAVCMSLANAANLVAGGVGKYGYKFMEILASFYPGYKAGSACASSIILLLVYSFIDMFVLIFVITWLAGKIKV